MSRKGHCEDSAESESFYLDYVSPIRGVGYESRSDPLGEGDLPGDGESNMGPSMEYMR